jgi:hypothetical protein
MARRYTTAREDAKFLSNALTDARREWKVLDECMSFKGPGTAIVEAIDGDTFHLSDGTSGHRSKMRRPKV